MRNVDEGMYAFDQEWECGVGLAYDPMRGDDNEARLGGFFGQDCEDIVKAAGAEVRRCYDKSFRQFE